MDRLSCGDCRFWITSSSANLVAFKRHPLLINVNCLLRFFIASNDELLARGIVLNQLLRGWLHRSGSIRTRKLLHTKRTLYLLGHRLSLSFQSKTLTEFSRMRYESRSQKRTSERGRSWIEAPNQGPPVYIRFEFQIWRLCPRLRDFQIRFHNHQI